MAQVVQEAHGVASRAALVAAELGDASEDSTGGLESAAPLSLLTDRTSQALLRPLYRTTVLMHLRKVMDKWRQNRSFVFSFLSHLCDALHHHDTLRRYSWE